MRKAIIVDIDGTVADMGKGEPGRRGPFDWDRVGEDEVIWPIADLVRLIASRQDIHILCVSGRKEQARAQTAHWLRVRARIFFSALWMRADDDNRPDEQMKEEIYRQHIEPGFEVLYVLDDRDKVVKMWRSLGLTCLQVAEGDF